MVVDADVKCLIVIVLFQHPRVRYAACNAVGQMSADFAPLFEKKFHDKVVPGLLMVLDDKANPRTQAHAGTLQHVEPIVGAGDAAELSHVPA